MSAKNKIPFIIFLFLIAMTAWSQDEYKFFKNSLLGVKIGGNLSSIALQPTTASINGQFSYTAGLSFAFSKNKYVGIQLDLLLNQRKWTETFDNTWDVVTEIQYIQFPLMTNISLGNGRFKYLINLGTYFAFLSDEKLVSELPPDHESYDDVNQRDKRNGDFGLLIGGGFRYFSKIGVFQLDARFEYGYQNLFDEDSSGFRYSNISAVQLGLYYFINLNSQKD
jgi:hypothetical protein